MKRRILKPAIKTLSGRVVSKPRPAHHKDIGVKGERGFIATHPRKFVGRQEAKHIAKESGQAKVRGKRGLHSGDVW